MGCPSSYPHLALMHPIIFPFFRARFFQLPFTPVSRQIPFFLFFVVSQLNGIPTPLPAEFPGPLTITETRTALRISRAPGFLVELGATGVTVEVPREARARLCGLCGDYDGAAGNDLRGPDGTVTSDTRALAEAWLAPDFTCRH